MSQDRLIPLAIHFIVDHGTWTPQEWRARKQGRIPSYGKPTPENIAKHVAVVEASTQPGGVNAHIGATKILRAWVVDQTTKKIVAEYTA